MKNLLSIVLAFCIVSNLAMADCDWSKDITPLPDGSFKYTAACNLRVGKLVQDNKAKDAQISDLNQALTLKDLALKKSDERAQLWMNTSSDLENRLQKVDSLEKKNEWIYFGLGVFTTFAAGYAISRGVK